MEHTQNPQRSQQISMINLVSIITNIIAEGASESPLNDLKNSLAGSFNGVTLKVILHQSLSGMTI